MRTTTVLMLTLASLGCSKKVPPISNFKVEKVTHTRAAIFGPDTWQVLDSTGNYAPGVLDSIVLTGNDARTAVTTLLAGINYTLPTQIEPDPNGYIAYGALCHTPHFLLLAYDEKGRQTNSFTVCFTCNNVRMTNYWKYSKSDELVISPEGEAAFMALQDELFPAYKGTLFWDPYRFLKLKQ